MKKLRKGDPIIVIAGKNKWKISSIESIQEDYVVVKDVNVVKKAVKGQWFLWRIFRWFIKFFWCSWSCKYSWLYCVTCKS